MTEIAVPTRTRQAYKDGTPNNTVLDGQPVLAQRGSVIDPYITLEAVEKAIVDAAGIIKNIADILGCNRSYVYRMISGNPELRECLKQVREATIDEIEAKLVERAKAGDMDAIKYYLRFQAKHRGYGEDDAMKSMADMDGLLERNVNVNVKVLHAVVDAEQAKSIFDVLAGAGAIPTLADGAEVDGVYTADADAAPVSVSSAPEP
jgi:hypothetical protein